MNSGERRIPYKFLLRLDDLWAVQAQPELAQKAVDAVLGRLKRRETIQTSHIKTEGVK